LLKLFWNILAETGFKIRWAGNSLLTVSWQKAGDDPMPAALVTDNGDVGATTIEKLVNALP
jgi:hypothetical protein